MKKTTLLIIGLLLATSLTRAQGVSMDFIPFHNQGYDIAQFQNIMQQHDGDLVSNVLVAHYDSVATPHVTRVGYIFYKVSPSSCQITDSLFQAFDPDTWSYYLYSPDPSGEGNLRVNIEPNGNGGTALRISHFSDDNLSINHAEDIVAPLYDDIATDYVESYMVDSQGDLIVKYYTRNANGSTVCHIARCGLDGTLKREAVLPESQNYLVTLGEFVSSSKQYYQWKVGNDENLLFYVIDSTFQVKNYYAVNKELEHVINGQLHVVEEFNFGSDNHNSTFVFPDGEDLLVAAPFTRDSNILNSVRERGAAVARYELRTMQRKAVAHFNDWPGYDTDARIMGFQQLSCGDLYLVYREPSPQGPTMSAVKMDRNLNVKWKRYCYDPNELKVDPHQGWFSDILRDEEGNEKGIYIAGYSSSQTAPYSGQFYFFLTDDDPLETNEGEIKIRPYIYYPNPVQDRLSLKYSPDVQPQAIELYDLQGRLVCSQTTSFETLSLEGLAAGQYVLKVTLENGKVFTDKVLKE